MSNLEGDDGYLTTANTTVGGKKPKKPRKKKQGAAAKGRPKRPVATAATGTTAAGAVPRQKKSKASKAGKAAPRPRARKDTGIVATTVDDRKLARSELEAAVAKAYAEHAVYASNCAALPTLAHVAVLDKPPKSLAPISLSGSSSGGRGDAGEADSKSPDPTRYARKMETMLAELHAERLSEYRHRQCLLVDLIAKYGLALLWRYPMSYLVKGNVEEDLLRIEYERLTKELFERPAETKMSERANAILGENESNVKGLAQCRNRACRSWDVLATPLQIRRADEGQHYKCRCNVCGEDFMIKN